MKKLFFVCGVLCLLAGQVYARSPFSARHSGMEAPGEKRQFSSTPSRPLSRTPEGGMGYVDAYGNPVTGENASKEVRKNHLRRPASSSAEKPAETLPDPEMASKPPLWKFQ